MENIQNLKTTVTPAFHRISLPFRGEGSKLTINQEIRKDYYTTSVSGCLSTGVQTLQRYLKEYLNPTTIRAITSTQITLMGQCLRAMTALFSTGWLLSFLLYVYVPSKQTSD
jgi:hypothetical protein